MIKCQRKGQLNVFYLQKWFSIDIARLETSRNQVSEWMSISRHFAKWAWFDKSNYVIYKIYKGQPITADVQVQTVSG